jgi:type I restriction enzyme S subunit
MSEQDATLDEFADHDDSDSSGSDQCDEDWPIEKLSDHTELVSGAHVKSDKVHSNDDSTPYLTGPEDFEGLGFTVTKYTDEPTKYCEPGDTLVTVKGSGCGQSAFSNQRACISRQLKALRPASSLNPLYLYYTISREEAFLETLSEGSAIPGLSNSHLTTLDVPVPDIKDQRKIASVLYNVDQAIQKTQEIESQLRQTQKGLVQDFLTIGLGDSEVRATDTKLGQLPSHWQVVTIENILADEENAFTDGARYSLSSAEIHETGDARAILLEEVGEGEFNDSSPKFATREKYEEITHRAIYPGEVVVAKMAEPVARACIVPDTYERYLLGCADVVRIVPNEDVDDRFLMYCMNSHKVWRQAVAHLRGTGRSRINLENIAELKIPKPPLAEQRDIAEVLHEFDRKVQNERDYRDRLQRLKQGLMQDLLSGTVRTTDTNIEVLPEVAQYG